MESPSVRALLNHALGGMARMLVGLSCVGAMSAGAVTIEAQDAKTKAPVSGFRFTIQEDPTFEHTPDVTGLAGNAQDTLSLAFHRSHAKVVKVGHTSGSSIEFAAPDSTKRYFVTVMPDNPGFGDAVPTGYTINGTSIRPGALSVAVPLNKLPFKTAQVSVFVFEDNAPVNGAPDSPGEQEAALCGFEVQLFEAGGTYGASGGRVSTDTFGNPLGTEYEFSNGAPVYNGDGSLKVAKPGSNQLWTDRNGVVRIKNLSPAKYTIYSIAPNKMPSVSRCNFADANGNPTDVPIWVPTEAQRTRPDQMVWDTPYEIAPPALDADKTKWHQTTTIEGTWGVDAWVKSGEPAFFKEFGPPGHHVWHGFVRRFKDTSTSGLLASGGSTVTGKVVSTHMSRPPGIRFYSGEPMSACWVALNEVVTGTGLGRTLYANACTEIPDTGRPLADQAGSFRISGLKQGQRYQLSIWDEPLDNVIANYEFTVPCDVSLPVLGCITPNVPKAVALNDVPVFSWFSKLQGKVFYDQEGTGFPIDVNGAEKPGIPGSIVNIRFRDGSIYQSTVTDDEGKYEFPEFFPFFNWMVAETDFTRFKATGATIISDNGGPTANPPSNLSGLWPDGQLTPQAQPENGDAPYRIFGGLDSGLTPGGAPVAPSSANLLQAVQGFLGQTNIIHWGKSAYSPGDPNDHGGITGVVHYASTRAEFDPKFATAENNEPGIPSVEIRLYTLNAQNQVVSPTRGVITPAQAGEQDAVQVVVSDSFDKAMPENCVDPLPYVDRTGKSFAGKCYDGLRIWNQVRDGVFDGGWAFVDYCPGGVTVNRDANGEFVDTSCVGGDPVNLPPGRYMTEGVAPYGYEHQKEEDKNVDFGDLLSPGTLANPAECIGSRSEAITYDDNGNPVPAPLLVPAELETFPGVEIPERFRDQANAPRPYCNKKLVVVAPGMNPFSDFHMFAKAPVAGHIVGMILDDLANEFDPYSPSFGEKYAPPFMPISIRDYAGNEINRVYSDRYGTYNALVPSTFAYNVPLPSGVAPNMVNVCLNSPTMKDAAGNTVLDPHYNPQYSQYCYTFQYLPGKTTYLDTPVLPIAAFAGPSQFALDCEQPEATPGIKMVTGTRTVGGVEPGPWVQQAGDGLRIISMGPTQVNNPAYEQTNLGTPGAPGVAPKTFTRNFGFGTRGAASRVLIGGVDVTAGVTSWTDAEIQLTVPASGTVIVNGLPSSVPVTSGTIEVVHANGNRTARGITLHIGGSQPIVVSAGQSIQDAIDNAGEGALITVGPGLYEEAPIVWKRLRVQGYGAPVSIINAAMGAEYVRQQAWREKVCDLVGSTATPGPMASALVGDQVLPATREACLAGDTVDNAPLLFASEEASGFFILQNTMAGGTGNRNFAARSLAALQIDGFTVTGADTGGGIVANGNAVQLQISNNRITGNQGLFNGGIRIGHPGFINEVTQQNGTVVLEVGGSNNPLVNIHHNEILKNGNLAGETEGGGGGISLYTGADGYRVAKNYVCGNFSTGDGGGLVHYGRSTTLSVTTNAANPVANFIASDTRTQSGTTLAYAATVLDNQFRFNQSFSQAKTVQGGGIAVMGVPDPNADNGLSAGSGNVVVANNVIQGNLAGAGDGGGIALVGVNGTEVQGTTSTASWNRVDIVNNVIVNNGAGVAGGGISLLDSSNVYIVNNTVSLNDSYATAARAFSGGDPTQAQNGLDKIATSSLQNGAGIASYRHSAPLRAVMPTAIGLGNHRVFSNATILDTAVIGNRRYQWQVNYNVAQDQAACRYDASTGINPCFGLGHLVGTTLTAGPAAQSDAGNDIAVIGGVTGALAPTYSVFTAQNAADGTTGATNRAGTASAFASAYANGDNGALKQLVFAVEQSVPLGAPVLEVQEPTTATTAAAFDEGGNFIDVRFGPLTRGTCTTLASLTSPACTTTWTDFGVYNPDAPAALPLNGGSAVTSTTYSLFVRNLLQSDRNGSPRTAGNWVRGALQQ